jgi:hypothetical protein
MPEITTAPGSAEHLETRGKIGRLTHHCLLLSRALTEEVTDDHQTRSNANAHLQGRLIGGNRTPGSMLLKI